MTMLTKPQLRRVQDTRRRQENLLGVLFILAVWCVCGYAIALLGFGAIS